MTFRFSIKITRSGGESNSFCIRPVRDGSMSKVKCKAKDPNNCRYHGTGKFEDSAATTTTMSAKEARVAYLTTPEGIQELREKGKHELADKYEARRART